MNHERVGGAGCSQYIGKRCIEPGPVFGAAAPGLDGYGHRGVRGLSTGPGIGVVACRQHGEQFGCLGPDCLTRQLVQSGPKFPIENQHLYASTVPGP